jgi:hypothetical protein
MVRKLFLDQIILCVSLLSFLSCANHSHVSVPTDGSPSGGGGNSLSNENYINVFSISGRLGAISGTEITVVMP